MDTINNTELNGVPISALTPEAADFVEDILGIPQIGQVQEVIDAVNQEASDIAGVPASALEHQDTEESTPIVEEPITTVDASDMVMEDMLGISTDEVDEGEVTTIEALALEDMDNLMTELSGDNEESGDTDTDTNAPNDNTSTEAESDLEEDVHEQEPDNTLIRPNSETLLVSEVTSRFSGAIWAEKIHSQTVILAGVGGIGSYVGFLLSRVNPARIIIYDPDIVEVGNMSGQLYSYSDRDNLKARALANMIHGYSSFYNIYANSTRYDEDSSTSDIMVCGFDNMAARAMFFRKWLHHVEESEHPEECLFIDGRLAAEEFQVFCIRGNDAYHKNKYLENWLFSDEEAEATQCSYKQTSHCAMMIASVMVNLFVNFIANQCEPLVDRDVPFFTSYDATTMYFKTQS